MISASASRSVSYPASYLEASYLIAAIYIWELINSFIRDPSFSPKKNLLSPNFRLPAFYLSPKYVVFMCAMYVVFCSRQWLLLYGQTQNRISLFVSMCLLLNC